MSDIYLFFLPLDYAQTPFSRHILLIKLAKSAHVPGRLWNLLDIPYHKNVLCKYLLRSIVV